MCHNFQMKGCINFQLHKSMENTEHHMQEMFKIRVEDQGQPISTRLCGALELIIQEQMNRELKFGTQVVYTTPVPSTCIWCTRKCKVKGLKVKVTRPHKAQVQNAA